MPKTLILTLFFILFIISAVDAVNINKIEVIGNKRISTETIIMFGEVDNNKDLSTKDLNQILKNLYNTNFFSDVKLNVKDKTLIISVAENPIIQSIEIKGIKAKKVIEPILESLSLKKNYSFIKYLAKKDKEKFLSLLKNSGYYFADIDLKIVSNTNNTVTMIYDVNIGKKSKISKIKFIGDKKYKNRKLYKIIASEENKFWKLISSNKFLDQSRIDLDVRLLESFYKNKGYYNARVESSFVQYQKDGDFILTFKINAGDKFFFSDLELNLPSDYDENNFSDINELFQKIKNKPYSYYRIEKILDKIEMIALQDQYESINATVQTNIVENNKLDFLISINETAKEYVERINILGNNITREEVLRNELLIDEGDAFNNILHAKSMNNLKSLNFFKSVNHEIFEGSSKNTKIINIRVEEKPTGEITAGVGVGTNGGAFGAGIKENNFLGRGIKLDSKIELNEESIRGKFSVINPNWRGTKQTLSFNAQSLVRDRLKEFGYKTSTTGFSLGSRFEYYEDLHIAPSFSIYYESLKTSSTASTNIKKQKGTYLDSDFDYSIDYDKRNQKYQPTEGFRSRFTQSIPIISDTNAILNGYEFNAYHELSDGMIGSFGFYGRAINSLTGDDVRISERLYIPSSKLRGFERGKTGPIDSGDYVGGNYVSTVNLVATLPNFIPSVQNADFSIFYDVGNVWGVDYDSSVDDTNKIRSSAGIAVDWYTPIGPLSFSYTGVISKAPNDKTESFRFNLGTTF